MLGEHRKYMDNFEKFHFYSQNLFASKNLVIVRTGTNNSLFGVDTFCCTRPSAASGRLLLDGDAQTYGIKRTH